MSDGAPARGGTMTTVSTASSLPKTRDLRLTLYVVVGALLGVGYVLFDVASESRLRQGTLTGFMAEAHTVIDRLSPVLVGVLLGLSAHSLWLRARLSRVERDQAVWVLAAAMLHELNNPLHAIGLLLDELTEPEVEVEVAHRRGILERIHGQVDRARGHLQTLRTMRATGE